MDDFKNMSLSLKMCFIGISGTPIDFLSAPYILLNYFNIKSKLSTRAESKVFSYTMTMKNDTDFEIKCEKIYLDIIGFFNENKYEKNLGLTTLKKQIPLVCFSCYIWNIDAVKYLSNKLKENLSNITILWGGPEICRDFILNGVFDSCPVDYLIYGEGELAFTKFIEAFISNRISLIDSISNIGQKKNNRFVCNNYINEPEDMTKIPSAILNRYMDEVISLPGMRVNIETQRGCNFRCAYCFYHKSFKGIRYRDPNVVVEEILYVYNKGCKIIRIIDANFVSNKEHALTIMNGLIQNRINMSIMIECLPQFIDEEIADIFGKYVKINDNKLMVGIGIQSLNEKSMKTIKRYINKKFFENAFELLKQKNIIVKSDIILGLPYETKKTYYESIEFLVNLQRHGYNLASIGLLRILPGTDLAKIADELKLVYDKADSEHYVYSTPTLQRSDMLECLRISTVVSRIISARDSDSKIKLRDLYFEVKDTLNVSNIELLHSLSKFFEEYLSNKISDYVKPDFPNAEYYYCYKVDNDIPDAVVRNMLLKLKDANKLIKKLEQVK